VRRDFADNTFQAIARPPARVGRFYGTASSLAARFFIMAGIYEQMGNLLA
jgi:hypothetical protein